MSIIACTASLEASLSAFPAYVLINTTDTFAAIQTVGYLNGQTLQPCGAITAPTFLNGQIALVSTSDLGTVMMNVVVSGSNTSLTPRNAIATSLATSPPASSSASLVLGTAYQNTTGHDIMLSVYLDITAALTASILLGVGSTSSPTQQTIISGLTLSVLGIIPVDIYLPNNYYAKLSTSGTITASISGQIAMAI